MPKIIVQANRSDGDAGRVTFSERVVATHLQDDHHAAQLIERLAWAVIDAERLESHSDGEPLSPCCQGLRRQTRPAPSAITSEPPPRRELTLFRADPPRRNRPLKALAAGA